MRDPDPPPSDLPDAAPPADKTKIAGMLSLSSSFISDKKDQERAQEMQRRATDHREVETFDVAEDDSVVGIRYKVLQPGDENYACPDDEKDGAAIS